jgi:hypothetical protein
LKHISTNLPYQIQVPMDPSRLLHIINDNIFTDVELILNDDSDKIAIHAHKAILICHSEYFYKLFTFGDNASRNKFNLNVDNARIFHDIILTFYGRDLPEEYNDPIYTIPIFLCRDFLGLTNDVTKLYDIIVDPSDFDIFSYIANRFDTNDTKLISAMVRNIPDNYPIENLPKSFLSEISKNVFNNKLIYANSNEISYIEYGTDTSTYCLPVHDKITHRNIHRISSATGSYRHYLTYSLSTNCIAYVTSHGYLVRDMTGIIISEGNEHKSIDISPNGSLIAVAGKEKIIIYHEFSYTVKHRSNTSGLVKFSPDNKWLVIGDDNGTITLFDVILGQNTDSLSAHNITVSGLAFTLDGYLLATADVEGNINVWNFSTRELITGFKLASGIVYVVFSRDGRKIAACDQQGSITIWGMDDETSYIFNHDKPALSMVFSYSGQKITVITSTDVIVLNMVTNAIVNRIDFVFATTTATLYPFYQTNLSNFEMRLVNYLTKNDITSLD